MLISAISASSAISAESLRYIYNANRANMFILVIAHLAHFPISTAISANCHRHTRLKCTNNVLLKIALIALRANIAPCSKPDH